MFYIQARNQNNQNRESGSDEFIVAISRPDVLRQLEEERARIIAVKAKEEEDKKKQGNKKVEKEEQQE